MAHCPGTNADPCRSGRGGGPARAATGALCGTCRRRKATLSSPAGHAASTAASAAARQDATLADAQATLRSMQSASERITDDGLELVGELIDHLSSLSGIPGSDVLRDWYDPSDSDLSHAERRARRHAALLLAEALIKNGAASSDDAESIVGPPVQRPEGFSAQQQAPRRPRTTIEHAQQVWSAAASATGTPVERWIKETRRAMSSNATSTPWALRMLAPQQLRDMSQELPLATEFPDSTDCIAVWAHQDIDGAIRCVSLESLHESEQGVETTEPRWRPQVGKRADSAMFFSPDGEALISKNAEKVYMVEGPVDAVAVSAHHQAPAVACGGTSWSADVADIISRRCPQADIICIADGDEVGRKAMQQAARRIPQVVEVVEMPAGVDPGEYFAFEHERPGAPSKPLDQGTRQGHK